MAQSRFAFRKPANGRRFCYNWLQTQCGIEGELTMAEITWTMHGREFVNCNCSYGCPCQFSALPTHGHCRAVAGIQIDRGNHGGVSLDGLRIAGVYRWPGAIHQGNGEAQAFVDKRASEAQRNALLRIMSGQDTKPGATMFSIYTSMVTKFHPPVFTDIEFQVDIDRRRARLHVPDYIDQQGEPILNAVTGAESRARIDLPNGFEFTLAEIGRGWSKTSGAVAFELADTYGQFAELHLNQDGVIR
jgi:hypothetical protein